MILTSTLLTNCLIITCSIGIPFVSYICMKEFNVIAYEKKKQELRDAIEKEKIQLEIKDTTTKLNKAQSSNLNINTKGMF